ncbi:MAG TPA: DUF411 domain-containing protein [Vicinamibacterales bacterium]|nr:DUF411 domain-containing protein [Vicinamibacterales bacterium]
MNTRYLAAAIVLAAFSLAAAIAASQPRKPGAQGPAKITVYKTPTCGCCAKWVEHMKANGFVPTVHDLPELGAIKAKHGIPAPLQSCHTAIVDGYVVEGHVPADVVRRMLKERPQAAGIAVPGMPMGSPGMEQGGRKDPYEVLTFDTSGKTTVFAKR